MPFWSAYEANLDSAVADMNNVERVAVRRLRDGGPVPAPLRQAGRALRAPRHLRLAAGAKPLGPKGGEPQAARAIFEVLRAGHLR
jgi:leucyl aminopeptidase